MNQLKPLLKSAALFFWNKVTWAALILVALFIFLYPIYESYQENKLLQACKAEHNVPKCKITQVAVPA